MAIADWVSIAVSLLAAIACALAAGRHRGRLRLAWALLGLSGIGWGLIGGAAAYFANALPFQTFDLRFTVAVGPAILALALLPSAPPLWGDRLRTLFDGTVVAGSLLFVSWAIGLGLVYRSVYGDLNQQLNALAHPVGDLVLAVMLTFVLYGALRTARLSRLLLGIGLLITIASDSLATWSQLGLAAASFSNLISWGWVAGFALLGAAALWEWRELRRPSRQRPTFVAAASILYLPLVAVALVVVVRQLEGQPTDPFLFWEGLAIVGLLVAREIATLQANRAFRRSFDQRLSERTEQLTRGEARFHTIVDRLPDATLLLDDQGTVQYESEAVERTLGRAPGSNHGRPWLSLVHPDDHGHLQSILEKSRQAAGVPITFEARVSHGDDGWRQAELTINNLISDSAVGAYLLMLRDITERRALEDQLAQHALHDELTGLVNRAVFRDRLGQSVIRAARRREQPAVLLLDIDEMKHITETLGNQAADQVLVAVADRLRECVRSGDTLAHLASDAFAALIEDSEHAEAPAHVAERILSELARVKIGPAAKPLTAGIGIASLPPGSQNADELLRNAESALAEAKAAGAGKIAIYDRAMTGSIGSQLELEADLQRAIERKEFVVHFQPIVRLRDGSPTAVEALVRWVHPWRGMLLPGDFIMAADKTGAIVSMGRWLLLDAAKHVRRWQDELGLPTLGLAVNLSVRQLGDEGLPNDIRHVLSETGLPADLLMLETRESALLDDLQRSATMLGKLKDVGAMLAIDDCRSGPSSLGYIRHLPVDTVKIDRSFVMNLGKERERSLVEAIIKTGDSLKVAIVAEGIEEPSQAAELLSMGCELGQGFHFSKPLAASQMFDYLDKQCRKKAA